jgi:hypothetical protein
MPSIAFSTDFESVFTSKGSFETFNTVSGPLRPFTLQCNVSFNQFYDNSLIPEGLDTFLQIRFIAIKFKYHLTDCFCDPRFPYVWHNIVFLGHGKDNRLFNEMLGESQLKAFFHRPLLILTLCNCRNN